MESGDLLELVLEQERIAARSLEICAILRRQCKLGEPGFTIAAQSSDEHPAIGVAPTSATIAAQSPDEHPAIGVAPTSADGGEGSGKQATAHHGAPLRLRSPKASRDSSPRKQRSLNASRTNSPLKEPLLKKDGSLEEPPVQQDRRRVFANPEIIKQELKARLADDAASLSEQDLYHDDGRFSAKIAGNATFQNCTFVVIILNMFWIGIDIDYNHSEFLFDAPAPFQIVEHAFCLYFVCELGVRFLALKHKCDCLAEKWFMFDAVLVLLMVWDTWVMNLLFFAFHDADMDTPNTQALRVLRLVRITRVARMVRLLRSVPEFMILVKGVGMAMRSVASTLVLLLLIIYVFAILFTELMAGTAAGKGCFDSVVGSMNCLMMDAIFADQAQLMEQVLSGGVTYYLLLLAFLVLTTLTVLNMLIGVMCELIGSTAEYEREVMIVDQVRDNVKKILPGLDVDGDGMISEDEFVSLVDSPEAVSMLAEVEVDVMALVDFAEYIFRGRDCISFDEFMLTIMKFRGGQRVTLKDIVDVREYLAGEIREAVRAMESLGNQKS